MDTMVPDRRLRPRELVLEAATRFGRSHVVHWAEELVAGRASDDDRRYPDIRWLKGQIGQTDYWRRVWGARALLHLGPDHAAVVLAATRDPAWRVREMALKVITAHALPDPEGQVEKLVQDRNLRVRVQAWRALGLPGDENPALQEQSR